MLSTHVQSIPLISIIAYLGKLDDGQSLHLMAIHLQCISRDQWSIYYILYIIHNTLCTLGTRYEVHVGTWSTSSLYTMFLISVGT